MLDFLGSDLFTLIVILLGISAAALISWCTPEQSEGERDRYEHRRRIEANHGR